jgi:cytochrome P450 family 6
MGLLFETTLQDVGALVTCIIAVVYVYFKISVSYWEKRNVPFIKPTFPFGNIKDLLLLRKPIGHAFAEIYKKLDGEKYGGFYAFAKPGFIFRDPEVIKSVLVKDFSSFHDRGFFIDEEFEPLTGHLFFLPGNRWRNLRAKLTPTFTSGKMKMMFQTLVDCGHELATILEKPANKEDVIEIKDILARYGTDVISSCAFGIQCHCLENPDAEFRQWGRKIFKSSILSSIILSLSALAPSSVASLKLRSVDPEVSKYFRRMVHDTVTYREKNNFQRNDFMQLLIQIKNKGKVEEDKKNSEMNGNGTTENKYGEYGKYCCVLNAKYARSCYSYYSISIRALTKTLHICLLLPTSATSLLP